jgi:hypothetical protein
VAQERHHLFLAGLLLTLVAVVVVHGLRVVGLLEALAALVGAVTVD